MKDDPAHVLQLAKTAINQQNPHLAIQHLRSIERAIEDALDTPIWAEHRLVLAEVYGALGDQAAPTFFDEAIDRLGRLREEHLHLLLRSREHYADFLCRFCRRFSKARELYVSAKGFASRIGQEDVARVQLKIIGLDLAVDNDPEFENFQTFKHVSLTRHVTYRKQLAVWMHHLGNQERAGTGLRAARNRSRAAERCFSDLIDSVGDLDE